MDSVYQVKSGVFEGPLELLLSLIEKRKLFINEISLAQVTDDYLEYVKKIGAFPISSIANFILVAATLILIKSRSLLPELTLTDEEEGSIGDLAQRLNLYRVIRDAGPDLKVWLSGPMLWERPFTRLRQPVFSPDASFTVDALANAMSGLLERLPKKEVLPEAIVKKVISLEEMIDDLTERITRETNTTFSKLAGHHGVSADRERKVHVIVGFLALLELVKQGLIAVEQQRNFEDIGISKNGNEHA